MKDLHSFSTYINVQTIPLQIGESHVDVSASSNDLTGTACLNFTPNNSCIGLSILLLIFLNSFINSIRINR